MPFATVNDVRYHFAQHNSDAFGAPLLLLHGFTGSAAGWESAVSHMACPLLAIDLLGHGQSDAPVDPARYAMAAAAADLAALLSTLALPPVHLLGYSMGGRLALYLALTCPELVRTLILESASPGLEGAEERAARRSADTALADFIEREGVAAFVARWEQLPLFASQAGLPDETSVALRTRRLENRPSGLANSLRGMGTGVQPPLWGGLHACNLPVRLITGELDAKFCAINNKMQQCMPAARHVVIAGAGHTVHLEAPGKFYACVTEFTQRHDSKTGQTP